MTDVIYLDHHATTPCDPRVVEAMLPWFTAHFGNPSSDTHDLGREARRAVEAARVEVAELLGGEPRGVVFTSGATEALSWAIQSATLLGKVDGRAEIVTVGTEHKAVLDTCELVRKRGHARVSFAVTMEDGRVDLDSLAKLITGRTALVAIMAANNETGVLQPIDQIGNLCADAGVPFLCDAVQAVGKVPFRFGLRGLSMAATSAHKMYGPKGIGALYIGDRSLQRRLEPLIAGGGQERGLRSGTMNVPAIVGFGRAAALAAVEGCVETERLRGLRDELLAGLRAGFPGLVVNGSMEHRLPHSLNVSFMGVEAQALIAAVPEIAVSSGSACNSAAVQPSHVLMAMGLGEERAFSAVRFGLGTGQSRTDCQTAANRFCEIAIILLETAAV